MPAAVSRPREEDLRLDAPHEISTVRQVPHANRREEWAETAGPVIAWICEVTDIPLPGAGGGACTEEDLRAHLKDGVVLCELANRIRPGSVKRVFGRHSQQAHANDASQSTSTTAANTSAFRQRENIGRFLAAASALGVQGHELFQTADLFEGGDAAAGAQGQHASMRQVIVCLAALGRAAHDVPSYTGPQFGKAAKAKLGAHKASLHAALEVGAGRWGTAAGQHRLSGPADKPVVHPVSATGFIAAPTLGPAA